ncbi:hypothetical protein CAAN1_01S09626 [[Candida] anglica]|uniref:Uncharacterized protein n=1 Tax=[Candida] anglica TaxID=148631 RepID=A0ABP0EK53_9ASCO
MQFALRRLKRLNSLHNVPRRRWINSSLKTVPVSVSKWSVYKWHDVDDISSTNISSDANNSKDNHTDIDPEKQERNANLGSTVEQLRELIPHIGSNSLPKSLLSPHILLQICPTHFDELNSYLPTIKGYVPYYATCKVLQLALTSIVLAPSVHLHIQSIRSFPLGTGGPRLPSCVYPEATKIVVRWTTSLDGRTELNSYSDALDRQGSHVPHGWSKVKPVEFVNNGDESKHFASFTEKLMELSTSIKLLAKDKDLDRVISGIFVFELNESNDQIIVHTIEDINILERTETQVDGELRVC